MSDAIQLTEHDLKNVWDYAVETPLPILDIQQQEAVE